MGLDPELFLEFESRTLKSRSWIRILNNEYIIPYPQLCLFVLTHCTLFYFQASPSSVAQHLNANDVDRIRLFMRDLVIKGVVPYAEKQLKQLNELVTNRKSRSLFSGAKRWFGTNKPNVVGGGTSVVYSKEAPELQVER